MLNSGDQDNYIFQVIYYCKSNLKLIEYAGNSGVQR